MFDPIHWPNWLQNTRLVFTFLLTAGFGIHAYYHHKQESADAMSHRRWMYWIYSVGFLAAGAVNFGLLCVSLVFHARAVTSLHVGYATLLLVLSYAALLFGVRRRDYE